VPEITLPTTEQARTLTDRIKIAVEGTWQMIQEAYTSRAWAVLGYDTWDAYCTEEFGTSRLRLPREERQEVVASLRESGLTVRAISAATGLGIGTVHRQVAAVPNGTPEAQSVVGIDGRVYGKSHQFDGSRLTSDDWTPPELDPEPKQKRRPLPEAFTDASRDLTRATERLERLADDDRFTRNVDATRRQVPDLIGALERTTQLVTALNLPEAEASEEARRWWATSLHKISDALRDVAHSIQKEH
jgi:hypothetical protein